MKEENIKNIEKNVPEIMAKEKAWVMYKNINKEGIIKKIPFQTNNEPAKTNDNNTWASYEEAIEIYKTSNNYDGIGFIFSINNSLVGIDMDDVIDTTNNIIHPDAMKIIETINSYTEISPSGKGIHIIAKSNHDVKSGNGKTINIKSVEIYNDKRYFTFTGKVYENYREINILPKDIVSKESLFKIIEKTNINSETEEDFIISKITKTRKGKSLFDGDLLEYKSLSEGDMALCRIIARYTNNKDTINNIVKKSKRNKEKWNEIHDCNNRTYGEITIDKVLNSLESKKQLIQDTISEYDMSIYLESKLKDKIKYINNKWHIMDSNNIARYDSKEEVYSIISEEISKVTQNMKCRNLLLSRKGIENIMYLYTKRCSVKDINSNPDVVNTINTCIDLKTGEPIMNKDNYDGRCLNVIYDKTAKAPLWEKYVYETMLYKKERVDFFKRVLGYAISGRTSEQVMFFFVGHGKNGKSKMVTILQELFGSYSRQMPAETLKATKLNTIGNDLYYIKDARAIFTTELNQDMQLDEAKIKQLTGQDKITTRPLYGEHIEYIPEFKIFYNTNNFPIISSKDDGMWRRIVYIPFEHYVEESDRDYELEEKLLQEKSGILNWILDGSRQWYKQHLDIPDEIREYAYNLRGKNDNVYDFIKECCIKNVGCFETTECLYEKYVEWLMKAEACEEKLSIRKFSAAFNKYNYTHSRKMVNNVMYRGINGIQIK